MYTWKIGRGKNLEEKPKNLPKTKAIHPWKGKDENLN